LKSLGPGVITGAADDDPSGIATYSVAGAQLGTKLPWTTLLTWPLMAGRGNLPDPKFHNGEPGGLRIRALAVSIIIPTKSIPRGQDTKPSRDTHSLFNEHCLIQFAGESAYSQWIFFVLNLGDNVLLDSGRLVSEDI
jgi:hypothetical protein